MAAVLEYLTAELLELSAKAAAQGKKNTKRITPRAVTLAVRHDADLGNLLKDVTLSRGGVVPSQEEEGQEVKVASASEESCLSGCDLAVIDR